jgi:hemolysin activation/secretion protein
MMGLYKYLAIIVTDACVTKDVVMSVAAIGVPSKWFQPLLVGLLLGPLVVSVAQAANLPLPDAGDALRSLQRSPLPQLSPETPALLPEQPLPAAVADDSALSLPVRRFQVEGNSRLSEEAIATLLRPYEGRELSFAQLQQVVLELTRLYRGEGYLLAQAYLPAQDIADGVVTIQVLEGRVAELRISPQGHLRAAMPRIAAMARQGAERDQVLVAADLERALLLLNDQPGLRVQAALEPAQQAGAANMELLVSQRPLLTGGLQLDNYGIAATGEYRLGADLQVLDPLGIGDLLSLRALVAEQDGLANGGVDYSLPLGDYGTRLRLGFSHLEYELGEEFRQLDGYGRASVVELGLSHPLIRQRQHNLTLRASYAHKRLTDVLSAVDIESRKRIDLLQLGLNYQRLDAWQGINSLDVAYSQGRLGLRDDISATLDSAAGGLGRAGHFSKVNVGLARIQPLAENWRLYLGILGQRALQNLDSVEKFSLGGPYSLRAYPVGEASGDHGWQASAELQWQTRDWLMLAAFVEKGWVRFDQQPSALDSTSKNRHLHAYGLSAVLGQSQGPRLSASLAWPGGAESLSDAGQQAPRLYVVLDYRF